MPHLMIFLPRTVFYNDFAKENISKWNAPFVALSPCRVFCGSLATDSIIKWGAPPNPKPTQRQLHRTPSQPQPNPLEPKVNPKPSNANLNAKANANARAAVFATAWVVDGDACRECMRPGQWLGTRSRIFRWANLTACRQTPKPRHRQIGNSI